jgi:hypothetical protein
MSGVTLSAAFAAGFLYGRKAKAIREPVRPKIVYIPLSKLEMPARTPFRLPEELFKRGIPPDALNRIAELAEKVYNIMLKREECTWMLYAASKALNEGRISPSTYQAIVRRYTARYVEVDEELEEASAKLSETVRQASLAAQNSAG